MTAVELTAPVGLFAGEHAEVDADNQAARGWRGGDVVGSRREGVFTDSDECFGTVGGPAILGRVVLGDGSAAADRVDGGDHGGGVVGREEGDQPDHAVLAPGLLEAAALLVAEVVVRLGGEHRPPVGMAEASHLGAGELAGQLDEDGLVVGSGDAGHRAGLVEGELAGGTGRGQLRELVQRPADPEQVVAAAQVEAGVLGEELGAGAGATLAPAA